MEHMHEKTLENVYVWTDGMELQFRSCYIFKLLARKGPTDAIGRMVKNVIFIKVKAGQLLVHSPLEVSEAVTKFVPSIHAAYLS